MSCSLIKNLNDFALIYFQFIKEYKKRCWEEGVSPKKQAVSLLLTLPIWMFTSSALYRMTGDERGLLRMYKIHLSVIFYCSN